MSNNFLDDEVLKKLSAYAQAQDAANQIEQRQLQALLRREGVFLAIVESNQELTAEVRKLLQYIRERSLADDVIREFFIELSEQVERLERNQILLLTEHNQVAILQAIDESAGSLEQRRLMRQYVRNYDRLREQAAIYGADVPLELVNKIERALQDIENLRQEIANG